MQHLPAAQRRCCRHCYRPTAAVIKPSHVVSVACKKDCARPYLPACLPAGRPSDDARSAASMCCTVLSFDLHPDMARPLRSCASLPVIFLVATCNICGMGIAAPPRLTYRPSYEAPAPWCRIRPGKSERSRVEHLNSKYASPQTNHVLPRLSHFHQSIGCLTISEPVLESGDWRLVRRGRRASGADDD